MNNYIELIDDLGGIAEIANELKVSPACVSNWRTRHPRTFPEPVRIFKMGPVFYISEVQRWHTAFEAGHYK